MVYKELTLSVISISRPCNEIYFSDAVLTLWLQSSLRTVAPLQTQVELLPSMCFNCSLLTDLLSDFREFILQVWQPPINVPLEREKKKIHGYFAMAQVY